MSGNTVEESLGWKRARKIVRILLVVIAILGTPAVMLVFIPVMTPLALAGLYGFCWWFSRAIRSEEEIERDEVKQLKRRFEAEQRERAREGKRRARKQARRDKKK